MTKNFKKKYFTNKYTVPPQKKNPPTTMKLLQPQTFTTYLKMMELEIDLSTDIKTYFSPKH